MREMHPMEKARMKESERVTMVKKKVRRMEKEFVRARMLSGLSCPLAASLDRRVMVYF